MSAASEGVPGAAAPAPAPAPDVWASPRRLPFALSPEGLGFLEMAVEDYAVASFLDGRLLETHGPVHWAAWTDVEAAARAAPATADWIFHMGHVGSTLISRILGRVDGVFALREPAILREFAAAERGTDPRLGTVTRLLSRVWRPDQRALIKATSFVTALGPSILSAQGEARAILLFAAPQGHIAGLLAGEASSRDVAALHAARAARLRRRLGPLPGLEAMSPGPRAALAWACELMGLADLAAAAPGRVMWVDFDRFLQEPGPGLARLLGHLGRDASPGVVEALLRSPEFGRYAKDQRHAFDANARRAVIAQALATHAQEVERGLSWLNSLGAAYPDFAQAARLSAAARGV